MSSRESGSTFEPSDREERGGSSHSSVPRRWTPPTTVHRAGLIALGLLAASAVVAACAGSDEGLQVPSDDAGGADGGAGPDVESDASDAGSDTDALLRDACSSAGWCATDVDSKLSFDDLWPLPGGAAVAVASRDGRSAVLLYERSSWHVIHEVPFVLTSVWADTADVWIAGADPGYVAHGHRQGNNGIDPEWNWTAHPIPVQTPVAVVRGTGEHEVYALADTRVWRLAEDGGGWAVDYGGDAPAPDTTFSSLSGTSKDDLWLTGNRGIFPPCAVVAHKTGGTWVTVIDGTADPFGPWPPVCEPPEGAVPLVAYPNIATVTAPNELVTFAEGIDGYIVARMRHLPDGGLEIAQHNIPTQPQIPIRDRRSIWGASADDLYLAGFSKVSRGRNLWGDGGWEISTVSYEGLPLATQFNVVRGTRSDDVWLAGESYVFHKTID
jgi:hypothetical protein